MKRKRAKRLLTEEQARSLLGLSSGSTYPTLNQGSIVQGLRESMLPRLATRYLVDLATDSHPKLIAPARMVSSRRRIVREIRQWLGRPIATDDIVSAVASFGTIAPEIVEIICKDLEKQSALAKPRKRKGE